MDVYKGHGEGDTKWKGCAWKLLLFKFNMIFYNKFIIRFFLKSHPNHSEYRFLLFLFYI